MFLPAAGLTLAFHPFPDFLLWRKFHFRNASVEVAGVRVGVTDVSCTFILFFPLVGFPHIYTRRFSASVFVVLFLKCEGGRGGDVA